MTETTSTATRVLIVEDEALVSLFIADVVEEMGFTVVGPAPGRDEALAAAGEAPPDVAIVDVSLKGSRDGVELAQELVTRHGVSVIFMSGHHDVGDWPEVRRIGPAAVLGKPCMPDQLEQALRGALTSRSPA